MRKTILIVTLALVGLGAKGQSREGFSKIDPAAGFNQRLEQQSSRTKSIKSNFTHIKHARAITNDVKMRGVFYYNTAGGQLALNYSDPRGNQVVIDGDKFAIQTAGKRTVVNSGSNPMLSQLSTMLGACITGNPSKLSKGWNTLYYESPKEYLVEMTPTDRRAKRYVAKVLLRFNKTDMLLNEMTLTEPSGDYSRYDFFDKQTNVAIDPSVFKL